MEEASRICLHTNFCLAGDSYVEAPFGLRA